MSQAYAYKGGAGAYQDVGIESGVMTATPERLIAMLLEGALLSIRGARLHMRDGDAARKGEAISRALDIINRGLLAALDRERGGEVADNLARIYDFAGRQLLLANLRNDPAGLDRAERLLADIQGAWSEIGSTPRVPVGGGAMA